jgi:ankyrin repeat protein
LQRRQFSNKPFSSRWEVSRTTARGKSQSSPALLKAAEHGDLKKIRELLAQGKNVNSRNRDGSTALAEAVLARQAAAVRVLLDQGADLNATDKEGITPLMWAANRGFYHLVKLLLEQGADPNRRDSGKHHGGQTALMYASPGARKVLELLLQYGADPRIRDAEGLTAVQDAMRQAWSAVHEGESAEAAAWRRKARWLRAFRKK